MTARLVAQSDVTAFTFTAAPIVASVPFTVEAGAQRYLLVAMKLRTNGIATNLPAALTVAFTGFGSASGAGTGAVVQAEGDANALLLQYRYLGLADGDASSDFSGTVDISVTGGDAGNYTGVLSVQVLAFEGVVAVEQANMDLQATPADISLPQTTFDEFGSVLVTYGVAAPSSVVIGCPQIAEDPTEWETILGGGANSRFAGGVRDFTEAETISWQYGAGTGRLAAFALLMAGEPELQFNCECEDENPNETLAQLRRRLLVRLGYSAQADTPPPGMADLLDDFLVSAQRYLYRKYTALRTERFFSWTMDSDNAVRFYDLNANEDVCTKRMDAYRVSWVGISDITGPNDTWLPLIEGIPPEFYTSANRPGVPTHYEIRQCIEVFPAPDRPYKLRIKAHFGLEAFADDDDQATIDSELLFLWALGVAKAHYGQPDAADVKQEAADYLKQLVHGSHGTARYVPGTEQLAATPTPIFLPRGE